MASQTVELARSGAQVARREEFSAIETQQSADLAVAAVAARERAVIEARYVMAERHPRTWSDVRMRMIEHCKRPKFAENSRYSKPVGKEKINGEWVDKKAKGFTIRFAETLAQEMRNVHPDVSVTFENDLIRLIRISVTDFEANLPWSREVTIAKAVEKRGFQKKNSGEWEPPDGREVISSRINSKGEVTYLVKATDDELRSKTNSECSKTHRDFLAKLCPRDILEDCEEQVLATLSAEVKRDPTKARKKILDRFHDLGVMPSDLSTYVGRSEERWTERDLEELRELGTGIRDGEITFQKAFEIRYSAVPEQGQGETKPQHDARLQRQMEEQKDVAKQRAEEREAETRKIDPDGQGSDPSAGQVEPPAAEPAPTPRRSWGRRS